MTSLEKKLGYKNGMQAKLVNSPSAYFSFFTSFPEDVIFENSTAVKKNLIHLFASTFEEIEIQLPKLKNEITTNGMIWVSWPKKSSKVFSEITEDDIRNTALALGLVDVKVCSINEIWSALKLVIPLKLR